MKYYRYLYTSESITNVDKLKVKLNLRKGKVGIYIIFWARNNDQLEIMNSLYLKQHFYRIKPPVVIGLAKSYDEAVELVIKMTNESLEKTGNPDIKNYLLKRVETRDFTIN